ncbi:hypothetical protein B0T11DRAFT_292870 [Plectosphaerella cucumerina]|uniref:Uncharacterized protein n=1 Tax=Plectosphaerella cucumerina TaxID=40658 RepID=A0A8K0TRR8_9PEZI|nr:hypothetical protein B0T11DRAFT_292870 [Plectosphaerella cucumerina]
MASAALLGAISTGCTLRRIQARLSSGKTAHGALFPGSITASSSDSRDEGTQLCPRRIGQQNLDSPSLRVFVSPHAPFPSLSCPALPCPALINASSFSRAVFWPTRTYEHRLQGPILDCGFGMAPNIQAGQTSMPPVGCRRRLVGLSAGDHPDFRAGYQQRPAADMDTQTGGGIS